MIEKAMNEEERRLYIQMLKEDREKRAKYYCTGCGVKTPMLVSLTCNCGGNFKEIKAIRIIELKRKIQNPLFQENGEWRFTD